MTDFNPDETMTTEVVVEQLKNIAESGEVNIAWTDLQRALTSRLGTILESYQERVDNKDEPQWEEPNVEKFNLENSRDEILELIASFNEPPFTIQRICELLYSPFKYYDRDGTFLRGLEKNLRVISPHDCPKSQQQHQQAEPRQPQTTKLDETTSNKISDINNSSSNSIVNNRTIEISNNDDNNNNNNHSSSSSSGSSGGGGDDVSGIENNDTDEVVAAAAVAAAANEQDNVRSNNNNSSEAESNQPLPPPEQPNVETNDDDELEIEKPSEEQTQDVVT